MNTTLGYGDRATVKATQEDVTVVTRVESGHRVKYYDCVDVKGKARRLRPAELADPK